MIEVDEGDHVTTRAGHFHCHLTQRKLNIHYGQQITIGKTFWKKVKKDTDKTLHMKFLFSRSILKNTSYKALTFRDSVKAQTATTCHAISLPQSDKYQHQYQLCGSNMNMFIKHHSSTHFPHNFSEDVPIGAWCSYAPQYHSQKKSSEAVTVQVLLNFPVRKSSLCIMLEDTFAHTWMMKSKILSSVFLASYKSICFPYTFHCACLCHCLTVSNCLTTVIHISHEQRD